MLIVEIDGGHHSAQVEYDEHRDAFLRAGGYKVVRFWNNEVLMNLNGVLESLTLTLSQRARELKAECRHTRSESGRGQG